MAGIRARKNGLISALKARGALGLLTPEQVDTFERLYRGAKSEAEQDEVTRALDLQINGWKENSDAFSRVLQAASDMGELGEDAEEEDSPEMKAALGRSQVTFRRKAV